MGCSSLEKRPTCDMGEISGSLSLVHINQGKPEMSDHACGYHLSPSLLVDQDPSRLLEES